jgi:hypothetical protein
MNKDKLNFALCTHDGRMRCFVDQFFGDKIPNMKDMRFKNCSILKLELNFLNNEASLTLEYSGEVTDEKRLYFVKKGDKKNNNDIEFLDKVNMNRDWKDLLFNQKAHDETLLPLLNHNITKKGIINIYIIRHGRGRHNLKAVLKPKSQTVDVEFTMSNKESDDREETKNN